MTPLHIFFRALVVGILVVLGALSLQAQPASQDGFYSFNPRPGTEDALFALAPCTVQPERAQFVLRNQRMEADAVCVARPSPRGVLIHAYRVRGLWYVHIETVQAVRRRCAQEGVVCVFDARFIQAL